MPSAEAIKRMIHMMLMLPLVVPIIITAVGIFFVYAKIGLVATMSGLVLANVMLGLPYVITSVVAGLQSFDPAQEMVARSLGMSRLRSFFAVTLPQIKASVLTGSIFAFISAMDETVVGLFISGGQYQPLTKRMFTALRDEIDPTIAAISTLMTAASFHPGADRQHAAKEKRLTAVSVPKIASLGDRPRAHCANCARLVTSTIPATGISTALSPAL